MDLKKVKSSTIDELGYDPATSTMRVKFKTGGVYDYDQVTPQVFTEMAGAKSVGGYFHKKIRTKFKHSKIGEKS